MNFKFILFSIFLIFQNFNLIAKITGSVKSYPNKKITLFEFDEYISGHKLIAGKTQTDSVGNFSFTIENTETNYYEIEIDSKTAGFYISKGTDYEIEIIPEKNTNKATLIFYNLPPDDLNILINNCKNKTADFLDQNIKTQGSGKFKINTKLFADSLVQSTKKYENKFYTNFVIYHSGSLEILAQTNNKYIFEKYIEPIAINYNHPEFYNLINTFYGNYFDEFSSKLYGQLLGKLLTTENGYAPLDSLLKKDEFLKNTEIRQLVAIKSLYENYYNKYFNQKIIKNILLDIANTTQYQPLKKIANMVYQSFAKNREGETFENFCLSNINGEKICLSDFKNNKSTLIEFTSGNNIVCQKEMSLLSNLNDKYKADLNFISVFLNSESKNTSINFVNANEQLSWTILFAENEELSSRYNFTNLPSYLILDPEKKILNADAPHPSENLENALKKLLVDSATPKPIIGEKN